MNIESIYNFKFLMNGGVNVSCMAPTQDEAERVIERLFNGYDSLDLKEKTFSHHPGNYSIAQPASVSDKKWSPAEPKKEEFSARVKTGDDALDSVMDAFAKGKKITL